MDKKAYEQRVQAIAEEMIKELIKTGHSRYLPEDSFVPVLAVVAVKHMAEAYKAGWCEIYDFSNDPEFGPDIQKGLIGLGLIPDEGQDVKIEYDPHGRVGVHNPDNAEPDRGQEAGSDAP